MASNPPMNLFGTTFIKSYDAMKKEKVIPAVKELEPKKNIFPWITYEVYMKS